MDLRPSLRRQHHLGLGMLRECISRCPVETWTAGNHPRTTWRIAYHALYFTYKYLQEDEKRFVEWEHHRPKVQNLWGRPGVVEPYSQEQMLAFLELVDGSVDELIDRADLECRTSGFRLYRMPKAELLMLNLRHLQGHVGQISEILMAEGIEIDWLGMS